MNELVQEELVQEELVVSNSPLHIHSHYLLFQGLFFQYDAIFHIQL
jgi:hypothetical protein